MRTMMNKEEGVGGAVIKGGWGVMKGGEGGKGREGKGEMWSGGTKSWETMTTRGRGHMIWPPCNCPPS